MLDLFIARRARRHAIELPCEIITNRWDEPVAHWASDVSAFGMWIPTSFPLKPGERVVVSFKPPAGPWSGRRWRNREVTVFAKVARTTSSGRRSRRHIATAPRSGMGLEFSDLTRRERRTLQRCLRGTSALHTARYIAMDRCAKASHGASLTAAKAR